MMTNNLSIDAEIDSAKAAGSIPQLADNPAIKNLEADTQTISTLPIYSEDLKLSVNKVETGKGVRVSKAVGEHPFLVEENLRQESFTVKHILIDQILAIKDAPVCRYEGSTYIVPVFKEVLVVEKRLHLTEEIHVIKTQHDVQHIQTVMLKKEEITIDEFDENMQK